MIPIKAIALDYGGYAAAFTVSQLSRREPRARFRHRPEPLPPGSLPRYPVMSNTLTCLVTGYGSTITADTIDHLTGQKPVDAGNAIRILHDDRHELAIARLHRLRPGKALPDGALLIQRIHQLRVFLEAT